MRPSAGRYGWLIGTWFICGEGVHGEEGKEMPRELCSASKGVCCGSQYTQSTSTKLADIAWTALMGRKDHASDARAILLIGMAVRIVCELCVVWRFTCCRDLCGPLAGHTFTKELLNSVGENVTSDDMPVYTTPLSSCCCDVNLDLTSVCPQAKQSFPTRCSANAVPTNIGNILSL